jgi:hypothetical protein
MRRFAHARGRRSLAEKRQVLGAITAVGAGSQRRPYRIHAVARFLLRHLDERRRMSLLYIILIVVLVLALLGFVGRGRY